MRNRACHSDAKFNRDWLGQFTARQGCVGALTPEKTMQDWFFSNHLYSR